MTLVIRASEAYRRNRLSYQPAWPRRSTDHGSTRSRPGTLGDFCLQVTVGTFQVRVMTARAGLIGGLSGVIDERSSCASAITRPFRPFSDLLWSARPLLYGWTQMADDHSVHRAFLAAAKSHESTHRRVDTHSGFAGHAPRWADAALAQMVVDQIIATRHTRWPSTNTRPADETSIHPIQR